jgi:hypothetical protein
MQLLAMAMGKMGFASAGAAGVALLGDEAATGDVVDERLIDKVPSNWKSSRSLASGSLAMVSWYLVERAPAFR